MTENERQPVRAFTVDETAAGERLDKFLSTVCPDLTRSAAARVIEEGGVLLNGAPGNKKDKLHPGTRVELRLPEPKPMEVLPEHIPLDVVYEDGDLLVVNKPKGMVVHPAPGNYTGTLVNALLYYCGDSLSGVGTISEISTEADNSQNNNMYYGGSDEMTTASKYPFYVTLDSSDGLMLGQHLLVSADTGAGESIEKTGIWLYSDYVQTDENGKTYVWAADKKDRLEKREVEVGQTDDTMGDCEIKSGLSEDDMIAFPSDSYQEGMKTTTNPDEATPEDDGTDRKSVV